MPEQEIQLAPTALKDFDYESRRLAATIPTGIDPKELLKPAFWAHHGKDLRPFNEIRCLSEDGSWIGYYLVLDCARNWAKVECLSFHELDKGTASADEVQEFIDAHEIAFRGPLKWAVKRKSDGAILTENISDKKEAEKWLEKHAKDTVGGAAKAA